MKIDENRTYNSLFKMMLNSDFSLLLKSEREKYVSNPNSAQIIESSIRVQEFLDKNHIPLTWKNPLLNYIKSGEYDLPLDEGVSLKIGSDEITQNTKELAIIKDINRNKVVSHESISLVITAKTKVDRLIRFLKANKKEIEFWQDKIELPEIDRPVWKDVFIAFRIILMKDLDKLTFEEIASKLTDEFVNDKEKYDRYSGAESVKNIYHRFKKYLGYK